MRKIITHPVVLILVVVVVASILLSGGKKVTGFSWFGLRTAKKNVSVEKNAYLQQKVENSVVNDIITAHTILASANSIYGDLSKVATISSIPQYIATSQKVLMIDIVSYLENAPDKEAALDSLVGQMSYYQNKGSEIKTQLQEIIATKNIDSKVCASEKEEGDRNFYQGLREGDATIMAEGLEASKKGGACQTIAKIDVNAHTVMLKRVTDIETTMNSVSSLLTAQNQNIITNFSLFKDTTLEKLLLLRNELRAKSPGTQ